MPSVSPALHAEKVAAEALKISLAEIHGRGVAHRLQAFGLHPRTSLPEIGGDITSWGDKKMGKPEHVHGKNN